MALLGPPQRDQEACSIQKLFSLEAEFEDEDFVLAVEDAEKQVSDPTPASSRCLRPPSSRLRTPSNSLVHGQDSCTLHPSEAVSPVLQVQNFSRLRFLQDSSPSEIKSNQVTSPLMTGFGVQKDQATLLAQSRPHCSSSTRFKFVKRHLAIPSTECAPHNEDFDNERFLAACMDLEEPEMLSCPRPSRSDCEGDHGVSGAATAKKIRVADSALLTNAVGMETSQLKGALKEASVGISSHLQPVEASSRLSLRPTAIGFHSLHSNPGTSITVGTLSSPAYQLPKSFHASLDKPLVRSSSPSGIPLPRSLAPRILSQSSFTPRIANSKLFPACGPPTASVESSPATPRTPCSTTPSGSLQTPVVTNHLVRLVTAANKTPQPLACVSLRAKTRRFPGPAGILPHQPDGKNLEEVMVSAPQTPTHGALAKLRTEGMPASQQPAEEECSRGPWLAMKNELGLDERDPSCFLKTYSVVMVLRKAALKQLPKNKVPNMAVMIRSLTRTNVDASAVFKDLTGEMQGTIHRVLLEQRESDFKAGSVLLLKQVSVFSPSHRNHYLNVTPNNLVKIYPPGLSGRKPPEPCEEIRTRAEVLLPPPPLQEESGSQQEPPTDAPGLDTMAATNGGKGQGCQVDENICQGPLASSKGALPPEADKSVLRSTSSSKADSDDLDQLLGELPDDFFSNSDVQGAW
ncbi:homologous recombination OB-fold protein [Eublepharis macularius]|uniref:Homologous recombination OB-fold protein n=1 Tax=Eublepharis macularius TaxID=481883 RepID=A0AA97LAS7_EUBMA|nr:homologous recombination OB-fold protein [Eublepharis macularius]